MYTYTFAIQSWRPIIVEVMWHPKVVSSLMGYHLHHQKHELNLVYIRKDCFQNKSKLTTEDHFVKYVNITIH